MNKAKYRLAIAELLEKAIAVLQTLPENEPDAID
ncbi:hypothetical protein SPLC1_S101820 [Arthrospira platensis C1]|nr:hypothetical protein SPLC1_S101820 [Arthrospira platensis C1]